MTSLVDNENNSDLPGVTYDVNESFPMLMSTCVKFMRESLNDRFSTAGFPITSEQWIILTFLAERDGVSQQDLAKRYDRSEVSILNLLKKLELSELIIRQRDPVDGRCNRVYLTIKGRKLHQQLIPHAKANIARMSEGIRDEELEQLKGIIRKINSNLHS